MGFVFYDLETTGISPAFDQPLQFAAIRTDDSVAEIERVNLRCRIAPHIIPSPQALIVTGVTDVFMNVINVEADHGTTERALFAASYGQ
jgi:exonuclease I